MEKLRNKISQVNDFLKNHVPKALRSIIPFAVGVGIAYSVLNLGEKVYDGEINGMDVVYEKGIYDFPFGLQNKMEVEVDGRKYTFFDTRDEEGSQSDDFIDCELERIVIKTDNVRENLKAKEDYESNLDDTHIDMVFRRGNSLYNSLRGSIYDSIEDQIPLP